MSRCNPCLPSRKKNLVRGDFNKKSKRGTFSDRSPYTGAQPGQKRRQGGGRSISNIPGFFCLTQIPLVLNYIILSANHYHRKPIWANLYEDIVSHLDWGLQEGRCLAFHSRPWNRIWCVSRHTDISWMIVCKLEDMDNFLKKLVLDSS